MLECKRCGKVQPVESFYNHPKNATGYDYWCKTCRKAYQVKLKKGKVARTRTFNNTFKEIFGLDWIKL